MSILIGEHTKVITQGITGKSGMFHTRLSQEYAPRFVGGVTPGKGGSNVLDLPVFDTVAEAKERTELQCFHDLCATSLCSRCNS